MIPYKNKLWVVLLFCVTIAGCDSVTTSFTDGFSVDPNQPTDAPADKIFVAGQVGTMVFMESHSARKASMYAQYFSGESRQYDIFFSYGATSTDNDTPWFMAYVRGLTNLRLARSKYLERQTISQNQIAATKILEAMLMGQVAALFGDVPYTEAVKADSTSEPEYDDQKDVYEEVNILLNEAIVTLEDNPKTPITGDATTLGGDTARWLKVAYTLKARYLMHMGDYSAALKAAQNGINEVDGSGDMKIPHGSQQGRNQNLYYNFTIVQRAGYLKAVRSHSDIMLENNNNNKTEEQARQDYFYMTDNAGRRSLNNVDGFAEDVASFPLVTYIENQMIIAEVEARSGENRQGVIDALNSSRDYLDMKFESNTENYQDLTLNDFQSGGIYANATLLQHVYNWTYLALIGQIEGFNFVRRIDYQIDGLNPVRGNAFPERFLYPLSELNTNPNTPTPPPGLFDPTPVNSNN